MSSTAVFERLYCVAFTRDSEVVLIAARILANPQLGGDVDRLSAFRVAQTLRVVHATFLMNVVEPHAHEIWKRERRDAKKLFKLMVQGVITSLADFPVPPPEGTP